MTTFLIREFYCILTFQLDDCGTIRVPSRPLVPSVVHNLFMIMTYVPTTPRFLLWCRTKLYFPHRFILSVIWPVINRGRYSHVGFIQSFVVVNNFSFVKVRTSSSQLSPLIAM
jgi:hypothetical protein